MVQRFFLSQSFYKRDRQNGRSDVDQEQRDVAARTELILQLACLPIEPICQCGHLTIGLIEFLLQLFVVIALLE